MRAHRFGADVKHDRQGPADTVLADWTRVRLSGNALNAAMVARLRMPAPRALKEIGDPIGLGANRAERQ